MVGHTLPEVKEKVLHLHQQELQYSVGTLPQIAIVSRDFAETDFTISNTTINLRYTPGGGVGNRFTNRH